MVFVERALDSLEPKLQVFVSHYVSAGNQTQALGKCVHGELGGAGGLQGTKGGRTSDPLNCGKQASPLYKVRAPQR